jgi:hypothetical protein
MRAEFVATGFMRVHYAVETNTFWLPHWVGDVNWEPRTDGQLARYPRLRPIDRDAFSRVIGPQGLLPWTVDIVSAAGGRAAVAFPARRFEAEIAERLVQSLRELFGASLPLASVVSDLAAPGAHVDVPSSVDASERALLAYAVCRGIFRMDWDGSGTYDPFVVDLDHDEKVRLYVHLGTRDGEPHDWVTDRRE